MDINLLLINERNKNKHTENELNCIDTTIESVVTTTTNNHEI